MILPDTTSEILVTTDGVRLHFEIAGNKSNPVMLFLHGGFGSTESFNSLYKCFSTDYRLIRIDSRGHGRSSLGEERLSYQRLQSDVELILAHLNTYELSILGLSDGGTTAYRLASMTSLNIKKIVTIGSRWHLKNAGHSKNKFLSMKGSDWKQELPSEYNSYLRLNPAPNFDLLTEKLTSMWLDPTATGYPDQKVENINCPLLIVRGDEDPFLSMEAVSELKHMVQGSRVFIIPDAGHVAFDGHENIFMETMREFLG